MVTLQKKICFIKQPLKKMVKLQKKLLNILYSETLMKSHNSLGKVPQPFMNLQIHSFSRN